MLWGEKGVVHRLFDPIADWQQVASDVRGKALPSGHYLAEEVPDETCAELLAFFRAPHCAGATPHAGGNG